MGLRQEAKKSFFEWFVRWGLQIKIPTPYVADESIERNRERGAWDIFFMPPQTDLAVLIDRIQPNFWNNIPEVIQLVGEDKGYWFWAYMTERGDSVYSYLVDDGISIYDLNLREYIILREYFIICQYLRFLGKKIDAATRTVVATSKHQAIWCGTDKETGQIINAVVPIDEIGEKDSLYVLRPKKIIK